MRIAVAIGLLLALAGCLSVYLAAEHQRLASRRWSPLPSRIAGGLLLAGALVALLQDLQPVAAVFMACTWAMLLFVLLPCLGALKTLWGTRE